MTSMPEPNHGRDRPVRRLAEAMVSPHSYGSVLILILLTYVLSVSMTQTWGRSLVLLVQIGTVWLALHVSGARRGVRTFAATLLAVASLVAAANLIWGAGDLTTPVVFMTSAVLYIIAPLSILRAIVLEREVDREIVLGAIDAYLLIGMFFAFAYQALGAVGSAPFFEGGVQGTVAESLFFSFTTLTTTGYGNLVPAANPGQTFAVMEMLIGQLFLITAVAKVINAWRPARWRAADGMSGDQGGRPDGDDDDA
jgi:hypothetical protein